MIGMQLTQLRKDIGITQQELAELFGIHVQTIGNWERQKDKTISVRKDGDFVNSYFQAMQLLAAVKTASILDTDRVIPSPFDFHNDVKKGELLFLKSQEAKKGDLVIVYEKEDQRKPYYIGRVIDVVSIILKIADHAGDIHRLTDPNRYKVIEMSIRQHYDPNKPLDSCSDDMLIKGFLNSVTPIDD